MSNTIFRGCEFEDCFISLEPTGYISMTPLDGIASGDSLSVNGEVKLYDGDPIEVCHGDTVIGTVNNSGGFTRAFVAGDDASTCYLRPTGASGHHIGYLEITRD